MATEAYSLLSLECDNHSMRMTAVRSKSARIFSKAEDLHCCTGRDGIESAKEKTSPDGTARTSSIILSSSVRVGGSESEKMVALDTLLGKPAKRLFLLLI